jgi:hypothetical protein
MAALVLVRTQSKNKTGSARELFRTTTICDSGIFDTDREFQKLTRHHKYCLLRFSAGISRRFGEIAVSIVKTEHRSNVFYPKLFP